MNILCFGDSNTYGISPLDGKRLPAHERWPGILAERLGSEHLVIEAGQPNRTLVNNPPFNGDKSGVKYLKPYLKAQPLDVVIIQLGTNDLKVRFDLTAEQVTQGLESLLLAITEYYQNITIAKPKIIIISPPVVNEVGSYKRVYAGASDKVIRLTINFKAMSDALQCGFIDGNRLISSCISEGVHWPYKEHNKLAIRLFQLLFI